MYSNKITVRLIQPLDGSDSITFICKKEVPVVTDNMLYFKDVNDIIYVFPSQNVLMITSEITDNVTAAPKK